MYKLIAIVVLITVSQTYGETGVCSWYGDLPAGALTADGEVFNENALTAAHKTLPFGTMVTASCNGKSVTVRINDRGPFVAGRILDLSKAAGAVLALANARNINQAGLDLIKVSEGFRANFYGDPVGIRTIGYGHNCQAKGCDSIHAPITQAQGEALLHQDLVGFQNCVENAVPFVNDNQFAALVSFSFNEGCGAFEGSTLLKDVKAKNYAAAANEFGKWVYAGGKVLPGLVTRRANEKALFLR
ncbi:unnamed protein product [Oppiella nova]|uniref:RlpA-like protein double-psi beta-barrel domain-containing protein n=1 Tax=Oppiella nova TaxID=334625 RepID=A0A7R9M799_9ACAR|nr:unnamed protein product [Oppiella nova]CAG2170907.1 unnamed protein product [Oppiella nova]